jgi:predicted ATPase/class 3 adenylate cyclase
MVTLLFTDIVGSTELWESRPDAMSIALTRHDALMRSAITSERGVVFKTIGDAFCAAFADAGDALVAALSAQRALADEPWPDTVTLRVRMALHSGVCEERDGDYFGPTVIRAARLAAVAHGRQVVLSEATTDLVRDRLPENVRLRDLGRHRLRDLTLPEHVFQLEADELPTSFPPLRSLGNLELGNNVPGQITSFVGRQRELTEIRGLLATHRLVTITGAGGCGKTRAAIEALADADGAWFVELAPLTDPDLVPMEIAATLGIQSTTGESMTATLTDILCDKDICLVLDNCEHVIEACAKEATVLLGACPRMRLLATSREPLDIEGEQVFRLGTLTLPPPQAECDRQVISESEAVQLFVVRGSAQRSGFTLNDDNAAAVASICRRLDGIPLALELAASRLSAFSVADLDARLDDRFRFLTSGRRTALPRQQTLHALVDWSYGLLVSAEQVLLRHLSVFVGGFTLESVERLCSEDPLADLDVVELVSSLTTKSLLEVEENTDPPRYGMLETIRQFADELLRDSGEESSARAAHAAVCLALVEDAAPHLWRAERIEWLARLDAEEDNVRKAIAALLADPVAGGGAMAMRLFIAMSRYWEMTGQAAYVLAVATSLLAHPGARERTSLWIKAVAALALVWRGDNWELAVFEPVVSEAAKLARAGGLHEESAVLHWSLAGNLIQRGELAKGTVIMEGAIGDARRSGDLTALGVALIAGSATGSNLFEMRARLEEALSCLRDAGDEYWKATALNNLAYAEMTYGDRRSARALIDEGIALSRGAGTSNMLTTLLSNLAELELDEGNAIAARSALGEAIGMQLRSGLLDNTSATLVGSVAGCASDLGEVGTAAFLYGAAHAVVDISEVGLSDWVDRHEERLRKRTSEPAFEAAFARGTRLRPREALMAAMAWISRSPEP